jgi:HSP20 family protein
MWSTRWPGFPEIATEMNRLRDEMNRVYGANALAEGGALQERGFPPVNVWEDDDSIYVEAELPGVEMDAIEIFVNGEDQLTVQGERSKPDSDDGTWHRQERSFGKFVRMLQLPNQVDPDKVRAEAKNGVLNISLAKRDEVKPRRIKVKTAK